MKRTELNQELNIELGKLLDFKNCLDLGNISELVQSNTRYFFVKSIRLLFKQHIDKRVEVCHWIDVVPVLDRATFLDDYNCLEAIRKIKIQENKAGHFAFDEKSVLVVYNYPHSVKTITLRLLSFNWHQVSAGHSVSE